MTIHSTITNSVYNQHNCPNSSKLFNYQQYKFIWNKVNSKILKTYSIDIILVFQSGNIYYLQVLFFSINFITIDTIPNLFSYNLMFLNIKVNHLALNVSIYHKNLLLYKQVLKENVLDLSVKYGSTKQHYKLQTFFPKVY